MRETAWWAYPNTAAKGAKTLEVIALVKSLEDWRGVLVTRGDGILDAEVVMEGIGPKLGGKIGAG